MVGWEYTSWLELFRRIISSLRFHRLLICKFQWRSIRLTNPWVVEYSLTTRHSSTLPSWLGLADLENFHKNHIGLGTLCGNERSLLCSHLFPTTEEHFSFLLILLDFSKWNCKKFGLWIVKVVVPHQLSHLLNGKILNYPLRCPHLHIFAHLHNPDLGGSKLRITTAPPVYYLTFSLAGLRF